MRTPSPVPISPGKVARKSWKRATLLLCRAWKMERHEAWPANEDETFRGDMYRAPPAICSSVYPFRRFRAAAS